MKKLCNEVQWKLYLELQSDLCLVESETYWNDNNGVMYTYIAILNAYILTHHHNNGIEV